jgi:hypothetical protein
MSIQQIPPAPTPWRRLVVIGVGVAAIVSIIVLAFSWTAVTATVKNLPVSVAGSTAASHQLEKALDTASPGTLTFTRADDRAAAVTLIKERKTYGAIVLGDSPEVLTSSAASPIVSQVLTGLAPTLQEQLNAAVAASGDSAHPVTVTVTDVVPFSGSDPRGSGLTAAAFPLTLGGLLGGVIAALLVVGAWRRVVSLSVYVTGGGVALAGILQGWFGIIQGDFFVNAGLIALTLLAISATIVGVVSLVGRVGTLVGPIVFLLFANPISSATQPLEFLPGPWGQVGQWFPPGAGATLLRDQSYFPSASTAFAWLVIAGWAALGVCLALVGHFRQGTTVEIVNDELPVDPHPAHLAHGRHPAHAA